MEQRPDSKQDRPEVPGTREEAEARHDEGEGAVGKDYSESDRTLKKAIEGERTRKGRLEEEGGEAGSGRVRFMSEDLVEPPADRIRNPFEELLLMDPRATKVVKRGTDGAWATDGGITMSAVEAERRKQREEVKGHHPDVPLPLGAEQVDRLMGPNEATMELKTDVADYLSRRDEMRLWWLEKMKTPPSHGAGQMLGVEVPQRNAYIDHDMMMRQFGKGHLPQTTEEWEIHNTWAHKKKYLRTAPTEPRYIKWGRRIGLSVLAYAWVGQVAYLYYGGHQANSSYRYSTTTDLTHELDRYHQGYRSRSTYPY